LRPLSAAHLATVHPQMPAPATTKSIFFMEHDYSKTYRSNRVTPKIILQFDFHHPHRFRQ
jgi:hypothetical protein